MDDILGFREFLLAAEQDRVDKLNHPDLTPQYLNACLPYAVALDVKEAWGDAASESIVPERCSGAIMYGPPPDCKRDCSERSAVCVNVSGL